MNEQHDPLPLGAESPDAKGLGMVEMPVAMVEGVYCRNGHFNDPEARYCAVCGISMGSLPKVRQMGRRPPLGVLIQDDGSASQLDADYVLGREPRGTFRWPRAGPGRSVLLTHPR